MTEKTLLTKDAIFGIQDLKTETVDVPEWGGTVKVTELTGEGRDKMQRLLLNPDGTRKDLLDVLGQIKINLVGLSVIDDAGNRLFSDEDLELLGKKSGTAIERIFIVSEKLNAIVGQEADSIAKN